MNHSKEVCDITQSLIDRLVKGHRDEYKNASAADHVRRSIVRFNETLGEGKRSASSANVHTRADGLEEVYQIKMENTLNLYVRMTCNKALSKAAAMVKRPSTFERFNRFVASAQQEAHPSQRDAVSKFFRDIISIVGDDFVYEVEHAEGEYDALFESRTSRQSVQIHMRVA
jgi:hypothetical protein